MLRSTYQKYYPTENWNRVFRVNLYIFAHWCHEKLLICMQVINLHSCVVNGETNTLKLQRIVTEKPDVIIYQLTFKRHILVICLLGLFHRASSVIIILWTFSLELYDQCTKNREAEIVSCMVPATSGP